MTIKIVLPDFGTDWFRDMPGMYIILSLKHSTREMSMFWLPDDCGYTSTLVNAGLYTRAQIETQPFYYNDGINTVSIPCTMAAFATLGIDTVLVDYAMLKAFLNKEVTETQE
jgi:hypothetical protein